MKNLIITFCLLTSMLSFSQEKPIKMYKATNVKKTESSSKIESVGKTSFANTARGGGGTVNGSTSDNLSVSISGAVNYSVPIDVPPGLNGIEPDISLSYDSHTGNGLAGWGWNVSGISVISRIPATSFHDNLYDGVDFDSDDRFALDGQRLIVKTGSYGADGTVYQTEEYSNAKIVSYGSHPDTDVQGPASFKVFYPDGSIGHYGDVSQSTNSRSKTDYALSYWENPQGVRISYYYNKEYNALSIDEITYGSRASNSPINKVKFLYENRARQEQSYVGGNSFSRRKRIERITITGSQNSGFRTYYLDYDTTPQLGYDRLTQIREYSSAVGSAWRAPIIFDYGDTSFSQATPLGAEASTLSLSNIEQRNAKVVSLDFTGNGKMDFIVYPTTGTDAKKKFWLFTDIQNSGGYNYSNAVNTGSFVDVFPVNWLTSDFKMNTKQGLAVVQNSGTSQVRFEVWAEGAPSAGPISNVYTKTWNAPTYNTESSCETGSYDYRISQKYLSGDFDGDGVSDMIAIGMPYSYTNCIETTLPPGETCSGSGGGTAKNGSSQKGSSANTCCECDSYDVNTSNVHLIKLDRRLTSNFASSVGSLSSSFQYSDQYYAVDVNGDGKTDILKFQDGKVEAYSLNIYNSHINLLWQMNDTDIDLDYPIMPGDYNGDGKSDFMLATGNNSYSFAVFVSTGDGFDKQVRTQPFEFKHFDPGSTLYGYNLVPVDINGDGKTDIIDYQTVTYNHTSNGTQSITVFQNEGSNPNLNPLSFEFAQVGSTLNHVGYLKHFPIPIFLNSNEANNNLDFATISDKWVTSFSFSKDHREDMTLKSITNNGVTTNIKYDQVNSFYLGSDQPGFEKSYTSSNSYLSQTYPFVNINVAPSFKVVRELEQTGDGITRKQQYYYEGAISHAGGLGFVGFEVMKQSNWYGDGVPAIWTISKHDPLLRGALVEQIVSNTHANNPSSYKSKVNYFYDYKLIANPGSPIAPPYIEDIFRSSALPGAQTDEAEVSITLQPGFHAIGSNGDYWGFITPPSEQPGDSGYAGAVDIRLNRMETDNGLTGVLTIETYTYDAYNNPLTTNTTYPGGSRNVTYQYYNNLSATNSSYHVGRIKKMVENLTLNGNSFNTEEQYSYNNNLLTQIKKRGNGTGWLTESFGHNINGNVTSRTLTDGADITRSESFEYSSTYGGRFLTKSTDIEGLITTFVYEAHTGNLDSTTNPYGRTTLYDHDNWGRVTKETDYLGQDTDHTYSNQSGGGLHHLTDYPDGGQERIEYNTFGWVTRNGALSLNNQWVYSDFEYYVDGKMKRESEPHHGSASQWNTYNFDEYDRPTTQTLYTGRSITYSYSGLTITVNDGSKTVVTTRDALGNTIKVQDPGGTVDYTYYAMGALKTADYGSNLVSVGIDGWGRRTSLSDPSAGSYTYSYNNVGELLTETTPKGTTTYEYDKPTGRLTTKKIEGDLTDLFLTYEYDLADTKRLKKIVGTDNIAAGRNYTYEYIYETGSHKRLKTIKENTGLANFEYTIDYDVYGRVEKETQTSNLSSGTPVVVKTKNVYDTSGLLKEIWNDQGTPEKLWEVGSINARGQALTVNLGNGITKTKVYDAYGYLEEIEDKESGTNPNPTVALHTEYNFHVQRGNLTSRQNHGFNWQESFQYDNQDRLTVISGDVTKTMEYNTNGTIKKNTSLGDYTYGDSSKTYQLTEIDPNTDGEAYFQAHPTQQISYNAFKKPVEIHQQGHGRVNLVYGPLMNRTTAYYGGEQTDIAQRRYEKHYSAIIPVEIVKDNQTGNIKTLTYAGGDAYSAPMVHIKESNAGGLDEYHYLHRDYLGSIMAITDADGDVKEELQFGAWGSVDKFLDSNAGTTFGHGSLLGRGYTGHEHFFEVSLIHMNGRMYDSQLGRFLSPDNFIQEPFNSQSYNRYGYAFNNPLKFVDPSGEFFLGGAEIGIFAKIIAWVAANWQYVAAAAVIIGAALFGDWDPNTSSGPAQNAAPAPNNNEPNTEFASTMSRQSRGGPEDSPGWLSQYWAGYKAGYKGYFKGIKDGAKNYWNRLNNDFWGLYKDQLRENAKNLIPGRMAYKIALEPTVSKISDAWNAGNALIDGDYYGAGVIGGNQAGGNTVELGTLVVGGGVGKVFTRGLGGVFSRFTRKAITNRSATLAKYSGVLRDAAKYKGNFGLGQGTASEAMELGKAWVGKGYTVASDGKTLVSSNGLRQFRPPSYKPRLGIRQANFEWRNNPSGAWQGNGHLDITD